MARTVQRAAEWRSHAPTLVLLALALAASTWGLGRALAWRVGLRSVLGSMLWVEVVGLCMALGLVLVAVVLELRDAARGESRAHPLVPLRRLFVVMVLAWVAFLAAIQPFQRIWLDLALAGAAGAWAAWLVGERWVRRSSRALRWLELALFSLTLTLVVLELGLRATAALRPTQLTAVGGTASLRNVERFRCRPGEVRYGFPCNEHGYYDDALTPRAAGEALAVAIGDSFNVGMVPHAWHYTTVCEQLLGVPVHNIGVAGIGPPGYAHLLVGEALPLEPSVIVVSVFVGNDLAYGDPDEGLPDAWLRSFLQRERVLAWVVPRRLARLSAERRRRGERPLASIRAEHDTAVTRDREALLAAYPWLSDPLLEEGSLSPQAYLRLAKQRAREVCRGEPPSWSSFRARLREMKAAAGATPLVVLLVPDEFQVEDALWSEIQAAAREPLERDLPQRLVGTWLASEGIDCLDLLPALRAVPPLSDGRRHVYHRDDSHFNARGNSVAGEQLARFLAPLLAR